LKPNLRPANLFSEALESEPERDLIGTIVAVAGNGATARVRLPGGEVLPRVPLSGGGKTGDAVRLRYSGGRYVALGTGDSASSAGGVTGVVVVGGAATSGGTPSPHDFLGTHHTLPTLSAGVFLASPAASGGAPSFRALAPSDIPAMTAPFITAALDASLPNERALVVSGLGLSVNDGLAGGNFTITLASSSNPGAAPSILATDASGYLSLVRLTLSDRLRTPLVDTAAGSLTLQPASDLLLSPGSNLVKLSTGKSLQSDNYASQLTGMRITHDGQADLRYLYTDELHAKSFIADLEQALAGGQIITPSVTMLYADFNVPNAGASGTFIVRDLPSATGMQVFPNRDIVRFRSFSRSAGSLTIGDAWGEVVLDTTYGTSGFDSATKTQRYTFYRYSGLTIADTTNDPITDTTGDPILASNVATPQGGLAGGTTVYADSIILDYGKNFGGYYETTTVDGIYGANSPYSQIVSWTLHPKNATLRTRLGNLVGVFSVSGEYGLFAGSGTATSDSYIRASSQGILLNNTPLALYSGGTQRVNIDATGTDVWFSSDGGTTKQLSWTGSALILNNASAVFTGTSTLIINSAGVFASDAASKPTFTTVTGTVTVNGETLAVGDTMLGDNTSGRGNVLFDQSASKLLIRAGTSNILSFDSQGLIDGVLNLGNGGIGLGTGGATFASPGASGGTCFKLYKDSLSGRGIIDMWNDTDISVRLDPGDGVIIRAGTGFVSNKALNFRTSTGVRTGEVYGYTDLSTYRAVRLRGWSDSSTYEADAYVNADNEHASGKASAYLYAARLTAPSSYLDARAIVQNYIDNAIPYASVSLIARSKGAVSAARLDLICNNGTQSWAATNVAKNWRIDHPLDPLNKWLDHYTVEGPQHYTLYAGQVALDDDGQATVQLPHYFDALNQRVRVIWSLVTGEMGHLKRANGGKVSDNQFGFVDGEPGQIIDWVIVAERADVWALAHPTTPEKEKGEGERGYVAAWVEYGLGPEYEQPMRMPKSSEADQPGAAPGDVAADGAARRRGSHTGA